MSKTITHSLMEDRVPLPRRLRLLVVSGPDEGLGLDLERGNRYVVGKDPDCHVCLHDESVSRRHMEIAYTSQSVIVRDLDSKNGTFFRGARITAVQVSAGSLFNVGRTALMLVEPPENPSRGSQPGTWPDADNHSYAGLIGRSAAMAKVYHSIRSVARSDVTVLVTGESGTGKEMVASAIHQISPRRDKPYRVVDLAATAGSLLESELFGHRKGAFTGAVENRPGAFVDAHGGTVFLDEIGELDAGLQPRLLRAVERREIKAVGETLYRSVDVRIIAATNRNLQEEVKQNRFRADLYHRLAVVIIALPPLRERREDIPLLVEHFLQQLGGDHHPEVSYQTMQMLVGHPWPGNVRQLRNSIERAFALSLTANNLDEALAERYVADLSPPGLSAGSPTAEGPGADPSIDPKIPFKEAKNAMVAEWERKYLEVLMKGCDGNVSQAARKSGIARVHLHRLLKKHDLGGS